MPTPIRLLSHLTMHTADELTPLVGNPNSMSPQSMDQLKASLRAHGLLENLVLQSGTLVVVGGNHRLLALKELIAEGELPPDAPIPCGEFAFTPDQLKKASLALNKIAGDMGAAALRDFLEDVVFTDDLDLAGAGLTATELDFLLATPWDDADIFGRSFVVKGKRKPAPPDEGGADPGPDDPDLPLTVCPECGHAWLEGN
jgi:hypothetical protein